MSFILLVFAVVFILIGIFFLTAGTIGFLRFPDFYSRMHATGKSDTLGLVLCLTGFALYNLHEGISLARLLVSIKIVLIAVFWFFGNPTATHALTRASFKSGILPWTKDGKTVIEWPPK
jgi:multicomponent Na+:H+ antiporter subunit G